MTLFKRFLILLVLLVLGCGGSVKTVHAANPFPPPQSLVCTGQPTDQGGQVCDFSDGVHYYRHDQFVVNVRSDGHGTFMIVTEVGVNQKSDLFKIDFTLPHQVSLLEMHATLTFTSWCEGNGVESIWVAGPGANNPELLVGGKTYNFHANESNAYVIPQVVFPVAVPVNSLEMQVFTDLCATSTTHWVMNGSF
jgi:hypothetical protein